MHLGVYKVYSRSMSKKGKYITHSKMSVELSPRDKEQKKLSLKAKALCKLANLFNNPSYEICDRGFDGGQVNGPPRKQ